MESQPSELAQSVRVLFSSNTLYLKYKAVTTGKMNPLYNLCAASLKIDFDLK